MAWFFLGILTLGAGLVAAELLVRMSPARLLKILRWVGILVAMLFVILLIIGVRNISLAALAGIAFALLSRAGMFSWKNPTRQGNPFQSATQSSSNVETNFLRMTLDHENDRLDGEILEGRFKGKLLSMLTMSELLEFRVTCQNQDPDSVPLVEAFLDRQFGAEWRQKARQGQADRESTSHDEAMSVERALNVLGLEPGASEDEIRAAHRRLMKKNHPDQGGSDFLARQINEAKDFLLAQ